jgi:archaellum component FlaC
LGDRPDAAGDGMTEQEFRQRIRDRLDGIDERTARMAERLDGINERVARMAERLDRLER